MRGIFTGLGLMILVVVVGCSSRVVPSITTDTKTIVRDSIVTREIPRFIEVKVPGEKVVVKEYIKCDSITNKVKPKTIRARSESAIVDVTFSSDGSVTATGGCDSLNAVVTAMDKEIFHLKHELTVESKEVVYKTRGIDIFCRWFAGIVILFLLVVVIIKLI